MPELCDVVVIGGGPAGLAAAAAVGRARRSATVVDAGQPGDAATDGVLNAPTGQGTSPQHLVAHGRDEARRHGARFICDRAVTARRVGDGFEVELSSGGTLSARRLIVATGERDDLPDLPRTDASSRVLDALGAARAAHPLGAGLGESYLADPLTCASSVAGVWLAGNVGQLDGTAIDAAAQGSTAAAMAVDDLVAADAAALVDVSTHAPGGGHAHAHGGADQPADATTFWEQHYGRSEQVWSGRVNPVLAEVAGALAAGRALDVGCGEGGDAVWLAGRGWQVEAIDVSDTALRRAARAAEEAGHAAAVTTARYDLEHELPTGSYDLISAQFFQSPLDFPRDRVLHDLAQRLTPGGVLLVVDHGSVPSWSPHHAMSFPTASETRDSIALDPGRFAIERCDSPTRTMIGPQGQEGVVADNVILARRLA